MVRLFVREKQQIRFSIEPGSNEFFLGKSRRFGIPFANDDLASALINNSSQKLEGADRDETI
jgi:hypothetical protein